jgi:hypothetical protein
MKQSKGCDGIEQVELNGNIAGKQQTNSDSCHGALKSAAVIVILLICVGILTWIVLDGLYPTDFGHWYAIGSIETGRMTIIEGDGKSFFNFDNKVYSYPHESNAKFTVDNGKKIRVVFTDGGSAEIEAHVRYTTPKTIEKRKQFHRTFYGVSNVEIAIRAHLINCIKAAGSTMTAIESPTWHPAEYARLVSIMLEKGLFSMKKVSKEITDPTTNKTIEIYATEIIYDDSDKPVVWSKSPLERYNIGILNCSITAYTYDAETTATMDKIHAVALHRELAARTDPNRIPEN